MTPNRSGELQNTSCIAPEGKKVNTLSTHLLECASVQE